MSSAEPTSPDRPVLIGWKEYLDLPELGLRDFKVKVDTGARTSALHVSSLEIGSVATDGSADISFEIPLARRDERTVRVTTRMLRQVKVTDSGGTSTVRPVIETEMRLGPVTKRILVTLTDRRGRLFRMLLGRKALEDDFVIDVSRKYETGVPPEVS